jgi:HK97 gp10 family phage protein
MKTTVKVEGLRELDAALGELSKSAARAVLRRVGLKALQPVAETARSLAPDDPATSGNDLKSSIGVGTKLSPRQARLARSAVRKGEADKHFAEVYAGAGPDPAAHNQEYGNIHHGAQPFMRPAWDQNKGKVLEIIKSDLGTEIEKSAKRAAARAARLKAKG